MIEPKKIKEITYSSEFVNELESKIEYLKEENALIKRRYTVLECQNHYLELYKEALKMAITNGIVIGGCDFWKEVAERYCLQQLYSRSIYRNAPNIHKGVLEFYLSLVADSKIKENEVSNND